MDKSSTNKRRMKNKNKKRMEERIKEAINKSPFINSFKIGRRFWHVLLFNMIFIILFISLIPLYTFVLRLNLDRMRPLDASAIRIKEMMEGKRELDSAVTQDIEVASSAINTFFLKMVVISIVFFIILITTTGYFKAKAWSKITKEEFNKNIVFKLSLLLLVWNLMWILLFLFSVFALKFKLDIIKVITTIEFFTYIYFSLLVIPIFFKSKKIFKSIKETFLIGIPKAYIIFPSILAMWLILSISSGLVINIAFSFPRIFLIIAIPLSLLYLTWIKFYINVVIEKVYHLR